MVEALISYLALILVIAGDVLADGCPDVTGVLERGWPPPAELGALPVNSR